MFVIFTMMRYLYEAPLYLFIYIFIFYLTRQRTSRYIEMVHQTEAAAFLERAQTV